jgi:subtilase family serine protease
MSWFPSGTARGPTRPRTSAALLAVMLVLSAFAPVGSAAMTASAAVSHGTPPRQRIKVLAAVLSKMRKKYAQYQFMTPGPQDVFDYGIGNLWRRGIDGTGTTVAVIEGWDDPHIGSVIKSFDAIFGLPNPSIRTVFPSGKLPAHCPPGMVRLGSYGSCAAWQGELELDVTAVHLIAPYAKIVISATPADSEITDDAASQVAPPEIMRALEYLARKHLANAISISDGTGESTYSYGSGEITAQDPGELAAAAAGIPVTVATGDCGVVQNRAVANAQCDDTTTTPDTAAWDDSPWVTAVGGSVPHLSSSGYKAGPDPLWNADGIFSEGAGYSSVFRRPGYQNGVAAITGSPTRSVPDITMDAQDGTSEAAPLFAGVLALASQLNRGNVGPVNNVLYHTLGPAGERDGIADVIKGNDSVTADGKVIVPGFHAARGFDVASGWGTINASRFVPALVAAIRAQHRDLATRRQAAAQLRRLQHSIRLSSTDIAAGKSAYLLDGGFLPWHPVRLYIDDRKIVTLHASALGTVTYMVDPSALGLPAGRHNLRLRSMLLTATTTFRSR